MKKRRDDGRQPIGTQSKAKQPLNRKPLTSKPKALLLSMTAGAVLMYAPELMAKPTKRKATVVNQATDTVTKPATTANLNEVVVSVSRDQTYADGLVSKKSHLGFLGNKSFLDTPFTTASYTDKFVEDVQAKNITDVIAATDPSVFSNNASGGWSENYYIRGFNSNTSDMAMNGLFGMAPYYRTVPDMFSRIEVLKGPSALLSGMPPGGSIAGTVNLVTKRAGDEPLVRLSPTYTSDAQWGGALDAGRRFGQNKQFGIRANAVYHEGSGPVRKQDLRSELLSLGLDWRGSRARIAADLYTAKDRVDGVLRGINLGKDLVVPSPPNPKTLLNPDWSYVTNKDRAAMIRAEYDLTDNIMAYAAYGRSKSKYQYNGATSATLLDNKGNILTKIGQLAFDVDKKSADVGVKGQFDTGAINHEWVVNATYYKHDQNDYGVRSVAGADTITNIYHPEWGKPVPFNTPLISVSSLELKSYGVADMLSLLQKRLQLTLGLRYQEVKSDNLSLGPRPGLTQYNKHALTPGAAVLFKATDHVSVYANYIEGLTKGDAAPVTAANYPKVFAPYKTKQTELGLKVDLGRFTHSFSVFNIKKPYSYTDITTNVFTDGGQQRNRGIEWNFVGSPIENLRLIGGVSYIKPELTKLAIHAYEGNIATGVPKLQGKLRTEWDINAARGVVTLLAAATAVSKQYLNQENTVSVPGHTLFDVGAHYRAKVAGHPFTVRADIKNVTNKAYWGMPQLSNLSLGAPRTFLLSGSYDF